MDGTTKLFEVDPATTCAELCKQIKETLGVKNLFGFSIYVSALEQVSSVCSCFLALTIFTHHDTLNEAS